MFYVGVIDTWKIFCFVFIVGITFIDGIVFIIHFLVHGLPSFRTCLSLPMLEIRLQEGCFAPPPACRPCRPCVTGVLRPRPPGDLAAVPGRRHHAAQDGHPAARAGPLRPHPAAAEQLPGAAAAAGPRRRARPGLHRSERVLRPRPVTDRPPSLHGRSQATLLGLCAVWFTVPCEECSMGEWRHCELLHMHFSLTYLYMTVFVPYLRYHCLNLT